MGPKIYCRIQCTSYQCWKRTTSRLQEGWDTEFPFSISLKITKIHNPAYVSTRLFRLPWISISKSFSTQLSHDQDRSNSRLLLTWPFNPLHVYFGNTRFHPNFSQIQCWQSLLFKSKLHWVRLSFQWNGLGSCFSLCYKGRKRTSRK